MKNDKRYLLHYWTYLKEHKGLLSIALLLIPFISLFTVLQPYLIKKAIDDAIIIGNTKLLYMITLLFGACILGDFICKTLQVFLFQFIGQKTILRIRKDLFKHVLNLSAQYYDKTPVGIITSRLTSDIESLNESFASGLITIFADILTLTGILIIMFILSPQLTFITLLVIPPLFIVVNICRIQLRKIFTVIRSTIGNLHSFIQEHLQGINVLQIYQQEEHCLSTFKTLNAKYKRATLHSVSYDALLYSLIESMNSVMIAVIIWYGWGGYVKETITLGLLVAFIDYIQKFFMPLKELSSKFAILQHALASLEKIFSTFDIKDHIQTGKTHYSTPQGHITFTNVSFAYEQFKEKKIIDEISFTVQPGKLLALVGPTGSGKTTVLRLLSRLYDGYSGNIKLDSHELSSIKLDDIHKHIAVVNQDTSLFSQSIAFNITLGNPDITKEHMIQAAKHVRIHDFIMSLPNNYSYILEQGSQSISSGQAQLITFARALASRSPIILLDEATSAVDSMAEKEIQAGISALLKQKTAIVVAHRLSTIQHADNILALNNGKIIEYGNHKTLMKQNGFYANLYNMQFANI